MYLFGKVQTEIHSLFNKSKYIELYTIRQLDERFRRLPFFTIFIYSYDIDIKFKFELYFTQEYKNKMIIRIK